MTKATRGNYALIDHDLLLSDQEAPAYVLKVRDLPIEEKPREKLLANGPENLSVSELLAILLGVGTKKEEVMTMAQRILKEYGEKAIIHQTDPSILSESLDIPIAKACQIVASFELGRRFYAQDDGKAIFVRNASQAFEYLRDMASNKKEHFKGLYLNSRYKVVHEELISVGSLTANIVHPREVFQPAIEHGAVAVIVAHNHPSGNLEPTEADLDVTSQLSAAGKILGIELLDHLIIAGENFKSIKET